MNAIDLLQKQVRQRMKNDPSHDFNHIMRVYKNAQKLCKKEKANEKLVLSAVLLHDIISYPKSSKKSEMSSLYSAKEAEKILNKLDFTEREIQIISDAISDAWLKYLKFAIYVVGISSGVRIWQLEKYITPLRHKDAKIVELTTERWVLEVYRTIIETLQGIAWLLLVFFIFALIAYVMVKIFESRKTKEKN